MNDHINVNTILCTQQPETSGRTTSRRIRLKGYHNSINIIQMESPVTKAFCLITVTYLSRLVYISSIIKTGRNYCDNKTFIFKMVTIYPMDTSNLPITIHLQIMISSLDSGYLVPRSFSTFSRSFTIKPVGHKKGMHACSIYVSLRDRHHCFQYLLYLHH